MQRRRSRVLDGAAETKPLYCRIDAELHKQVSIAAMKAGVSTSCYVEEMLRQWAKAQAEKVNKAEAARIEERARELAKQMVGGQADDDVRKRQAAAVRSMMGGS